MTTKTVEFTADNVGETWEDGFGRHWRILGVLPGHAPYPVEAELTPGNYRDFFGRRGQYFCGTSEQWRSLTKLNLVRPVRIDDGTLSAST